MKPSLTVSAIVLLVTFSSGYWIGSLKSGGESQTTPAPGTAASAAAGSSAKSSTNGTSALRRSASSQEGSGSDPSSAGSESFLTDTLARVKSLLRGGAMNNPSVAMKVIGLLSQIPDEDIPAALELVEDFKDPETKMMLYMAFLSRMAEKDGPAAIAYADEKLSHQGPMVQMSKMGIISAWAENDPEGAWAHYQKISQEESGTMGDGNMMLMSLFSIMSLQNQEGAFLKLAQLKDPDERQLALMGMAQSARDEGSQTRLLAEIAKLADPEERKVTRLAILSHVAMSDADRAIAMTAELPEAERREAARQMLGTLMMSEPQKAADFLLANSDPKSLSDSYTQIIGQWAHSDANTAGAWLNAQPQGAELDQARNTFATTVARRDPAAAMAWAVAITGENQRADAVANVHHIWKKRDQAAADAALEKTGLPADVIERIRVPPPVPAELPE